MTKRETTRRGFMAAVGVGAAALAVPAGVVAASTGEAGPMAHMRADYLRKIERLAAVYEPRFRSGELHGFTDADSAMEDAARQNGGKRRLAPIWRLQDELEAAHVPTFADAYMILACSPSEDLVDGGTMLGSAQGAAAECMSFDLFRIARQRGWYVADPSEEPSNEQLRLEVRS